MEIQGWLMLQILIWRKFFFPPSFYLISARGSDLPCLTFDLWMSYFAMEILGCWSHVRVFFKLVFFFLSNLNFFFNYFYLWWSSFFPCNSYMFVFLDVNVWIFFFFLLTRCIWSSNGLTLPLYADTDEPVGWFVLFLLIELGTSII